MWYLFDFLSLKAITIFLGLSLQLAACASDISNKTQEQKYMHYKDMCLLLFKNSFSQLGIRGKIKVP